MKPRYNRRLFSNSAFPAILVMSLAAVTSAFSGTIVWDGDVGGTGTDLGTGANWVGDVAPNGATSDVMQWDGTVAGALTLSYATASTLGAAPGVSFALTAAQTGSLAIDGSLGSGLRLGAAGVNIASGAGAFTLGDGTGTFNLTVVNANVSLTNNSANAATISSDVTMANSAAGNTALEFKGSGNWNVGANIASINAGRFDILKTGSGQLTLSGGGNLRGGASINGGTTYSAVLKEGNTIISGGAYANNASEFVVGGSDATGVNTSLVMNGGSLTGIGFFSVGRGNNGAGGSSNVTLNNSASVASTNMSLGFNPGTGAPTGTVTLNNTSSLTVGTGSSIGESTGSNMTVTLNDSATYTSSAGIVEVGQNSATGTINVNGTSNVNVASIRIGRGNNATATSKGYVNVNGGTFFSEGDIVLGYAGSGANGNIGKMVIDSGTVNIATNTLRWFILNQFDTSKGQLDVNGGNLNLNANSALRFSTGNSGSVATSVVNLNGGAITAFSDNHVTANGAGVVDLNYIGGAAANNTFNLNGGILGIRAVVTTNNSATTAFNFNGGTLKATGDDANFVSLGGVTQTAKVLAGGAIIDSNSHNVTIPEALLDGTGGGGLTKQGAGNLTLTGANTFTGATLVSGGTLTLNGGNVNTSSGITVNGSGSKLVLANNGTISTPVVLTQGSLDADGTINTLTVANDVANTLTTGNGAAYPLYSTSLTFNGAATLNVQATGASMTRYFNTTDLSTNAAGNVVVNASNTTGIWSSGTDYPVIDYSGTFTGNLAHFTLGTVSGLVANQTATLIENGGIFLRITSESLSWTGDQSHLWTTTAVGGAQNWLFDSSGIEYGNNDGVQFDDTATGTTDVILAENVSPSAVLFDNSSFDYTLSGGFGITGTTPFVKNGTGKLTISTDNSYTGSTAIFNGILEIAASGSIASSSMITVNDPGVLKFNLTTADEYPNPITGAGDIAKDGPGALTLSGANTFTGDFSWSAGALNLNSTTALGAGPGTFYVDGGGVIDNTSGSDLVMTPLKPQTWYADITFTGTNSLNMGNGVVTLGASRTVNVVNNTLAIGAVGDGASGYNLVKTGTGKLVLNGGDIDGNLDIQNGIVAINQDFFGAAPTGTGILQNDGAVGTKWTFWYGPADVTSNVLIRNNDSSNTTQLGIIKRGSGTLTLTNSSNVATSNLSVDSGKLVLNGGTYGSQNDNGSTVTNLTALVGSTAAANGSLEINGATVNYNNRSNAGAEVWRSTLNIGSNGTGAGSVNMTSGSFTTDKQLAVGTAAGAFGGFSQSGGTTSVGGFLAIGLGTANGVFNLSGGTYTMTAGPVTNGAGAGSLGVMSLSGNAVYNHNSPTANAIWIGENGTGILNVSGTAAINVPNNGIELGKNNAAGSVGRFNLLGGTVTTNSVSKPGAAATGVINFNGGTLAANIANASFMTGLTNAYVRAGGGTINNGGNAITIGQALLAPTGAGVSESGLTYTGGGYIAPPVVTITGDGTGATAVANIDANGDLTSITVTNPGNDYTTATVTLSGGGIGNNGALGGAASIVTNNSGGMTFGGAAITTLAGVNTYKGTTTVNSGTAVVVGSGAAVTVAPAANTVSSKVTGAGTVSFDGSLRVDLSGASIANGNTWTVVDVTTPIYDLFTFKVTSPALGDFTALGDGKNHELIDGANTWTFNEDTGVLSLSVAGGGSAYDAWTSLNSVTEGSTGDDDNDGIANMLEFALGGNPQASDTDILPQLDASGANFVFTFNREDESEAEVTLIFQYGSDLAGWTDVAMGDAEVTIDEGTPVENPDVITVTIPKGANTELFGRLKAVK